MYGFDGVLVGEQTGRVFGVHLCEVDSNVDLSVLCQHPELQPLPVTVTSSREHR
jgi:hypothetical protein